MRLRLLTGLICLAGGLCLAPSAMATTVSLGEVASPTGYDAGCGACSDVQFATAPGSPSYLVPPLPPSGQPWTLTSWSFRGGTGMGSSSARVLVWRLTGVPGEVRLVANAVDEVVASGQVGTFQASIPVQPGDLLGVRSGSNMDPTYVTSAAADVVVGAVGGPSVGETTGAPTSTYGHITGNNTRLNVAATLTSPDPLVQPPKKKKCKKKKHRRSAEAAKKKCKKRKKH